MQAVKALIDKASEVCKSDAEMARRLNVSRATVSLLRSGKREISPEMAAMLADIAGEDAVQATINAVIDGATGTPREGVLREILGKALAAGGAAMLGSSYKIDSMSATNSAAKSLTNGKRLIHRIYSNGLRGRLRNLCNFCVKKWCALLQRLRPMPIHTAPA